MIQSAKVCGQVSGDPCQVKRMLIKEELRTPGNREIKTAARITVKTEHNRLSEGLPQSRGKKRGLYFLPSELQGVGKEQVSNEASPSKEEAED